MVSPPLIGITAGNDPHIAEHYVLRWDYVHSVTAAGGIPVILAPGRAGAEPSYLERFDGLVLSGGADLRTETYGQSATAELRWPSQERDEFEIGLVGRALEIELPMLAICRGLQVLNVALGGTLIQDLPSVVGDRISHDDLERPRHALAHDVTLSPSSCLTRLLSKKQIDVNSFHHQAIDRLAPELVAIAHADDGVIEAVELEERSVLGVQWHPECFWQTGTFLPLFEALVETAATR